MRDMKDIELFFFPVNPDVLDGCDDAIGNKMANNIRIHTVGNFPDMSNATIALIGVEEERNAYNNKGCSFAPDMVRRSFYQLYYQEKMPRIVDFGNLRIGKQISDTYAVLSDIIASLIENKIIPVIIGGSQDLTYASYLAYEKLNHIANIVSIDPRFDIGREDLPLLSNAYINRIILRQPNYLLNYSNIGYQTYFVDPAEIELMDKLLFDSHRLGLARMDLIECEPIIRNADIFSLDMSAMRFAYSPGCNNASPNGFSGDEICKMVQWAGVSSKLSSFGIYEYNPTCDIANQSGILIAEILWYFMDGVSLRTDNIPNPSTREDHFNMYSVALHEGAYEIVFYKNKESGLWWMEVPIERKDYLKFGRHYIVPCSPKDYEIACSNEIPERWLQTYKKIKT
jgi:arginase family enzyme